MAKSQIFDYLSKLSSSSIYAISLIADIIPIYTGGGAYGIRSLATILNSLEKSKKSRFTRALMEAEKDGVLTFSGETVEMTQLGRKLLKHYLLEKIEPPRLLEWNGVWQIIGYDIPDSLKRSRDTFRYKLKRWDFQPIQESIWAYPWGCRDLIFLVAKEYGINQCVLYLHAYDLPHETRLRKHYHL